MAENQQSVSKWAEQTFGNGSIMAGIVRANEEMAELLWKALTADTADEIAAECADVVICLYTVATRLGVDLAEEVDKKMAINREREWVITAKGHGSHKPQQPAPFQRQKEANAAEIKKAKAAKLPEEKEIP